ncbi:hypothetical protein [Micromonospora chalcea]|uniref:hypothetical protein n=1 Tax=Micromonospora chalcea TaxID=1874 RepID=UPI003326CD29
MRAVQRDAGKHMASRIKLHPSPKPLSGHIHDALLDEINRAHSSTVNATIRRNGEWRSLSYSHQLGHGARRLAVLALQDSVTEFTGMCETLSTSMPDARELLFQANRLMTSAYEDLLRKMQLNGLSLYRDQLRTAAQFWIDNASEWGRAVELVTGAGMSVVRCGASRAGAAVAHPAVHEYGLHPAVRRRRCAAPDRHRRVHPRRGVADLPVR